MAFASSTLAQPVGAFVWPSVPERLGRELEAEDVQSRRLAASRLLELTPNLAEPLILRALEDADLEVRLEAAKAASKLRIIAALEAILGWLGESDPRLRLAGCELLRRAPTAKALGPLGRALSDPEVSVRRAAAEALSELELAEAVMPLLGRLDDPSTEVRIEVVRALTRIGDSRAVFALVGKTSDASDEVRVAAARALGELGDPRGTNALVLALRDRSLEVRVAALRALGLIRAEEATLAVVPFLSASDRERRAASIALGKLGTSAAIDALIRALDDEDPTRKSSHARDALVALGPRVKEPLLAILASPSSPHAAANAALALSELPAFGAAQFITEAMRRGSIANELGLRALAGSGDSSVLPTVLEMLGHARASVRKQAIETLVALLDPEEPDGRAVEPLVSALGHARTALDERIGMAKALGQTGSPRAVPVLASLTDARETSLRLAAIDALGALGPRGQDAVLLELLDDPHPVVRLRAAMALSSSASEKTAHLLLDKLTLAAEADRGALGVAVSGALSRAEDPEVAERAAELLASAGGSVRDSLLEGLGRMRGARAELGRASFSASREDRRKVAEGLSGHPEAQADLLRLLGDRDPSVRATAAWSLGRLDASLLPEALALIDDEEVNVAANAVASAARLAADEKGASEPVATALCGALERPEPQIRANALAGLALLRLRCGDGAKERGMLRNDESQLARSAAAALLHRAPAGDGGLDARALSRCRAEERAASVAAICEGSTPPTPNSRRDYILVFVVPDGESQPVPNAPFALLFADGLVRHGQADRRGAVFEGAAPPGALRLVVPGG